MKSRWSGYLADSLLLIALCLLFFWRDLTPVPADRRQFATGDFTYEFYAAAHYAAGRLQSGQLPLWNPYNDAGHPFLADIQTAVFYPPRLLNLLLAPGGDLSYHALEVEAILHFLLAAVSTYLLARRLTGRRVGGLAAASAFTFSGYLTSYPALQLAILETQAWLPLILLCLDVTGERLLSGEPARAIRPSIAAGGLLALAWLAGHPQAALIVSYGSVAFALFRWWPRPFDRAWTTWLPRLRALARFVVVGLGLAAVQWLPSLEFMRLSTRSAIGIDEAGSGFTPYDLLQTILPAVGAPIPALYTGVLTLGLAALAVFLVSKRSPAVSTDARLSVTFWAGSGGLATLLAFGQHLSVYPLFYLLLPGWGLFRHQERVIAWAVLAAAILAGYGAAWLSERRAGTPEQSAAATRLAHGAARGYAWAALGASVLALAFFVGYQAGRASLWGFTAAALYLALTLALSALALAARRPVWLIVLLLADLFTVNQGNHSGPVQAGLDATPPILALAAADTGAAAAGFRVADRGVLPPVHGDLWGVEDTGGASPLRLAGYQTLLDRVPPARAWELLNVKYVVSGEDGAPANAERVATANGPDGKPAYLYRLAQPAPRAWLAGQVVEEPDEDRAWARLAAPDFDPAQHVLLARRPAGYADTRACAGNITWTERRPEALALSVETGAPCILVLSELDYPGWTATVDGLRQPILRADGLLRALPLAAGRHQVTMSFRPASLAWGGALSALTCVLAAWAAWGPRVRAIRISEQKSWS